jgi:hypothetical protein
MSCCQLMTVRYARLLAVRLTPGTRVGPYEVVALLGVGGMAEVYGAKDTRLGRSGRRALALVALLTAIACSHDDSKSQSVPMDYGLMASVPHGCPPDTCKKCDFGRLAHERAGAGATDCGWSHKNAERQKVVECALRRAAAGGPFLP